MRERLRVGIRGAVQGVGFRPFVYRLCCELGLDGWVLNSPQGVSIELEGDRDRLEECLTRLARERPPRAVIQSLEPAWLDPVSYHGFEIRESAKGGETAALVLPDIATCADCLAELRDPDNRRYRYPFTNCTNCGPRFSIIEALPYDRVNTSMRIFEMCPACRREYDDPADRRFHAQPNACPVCGPQVALWNASHDIALRDDAVRAAAAILRDGRIVAVKGIGGFHLMVDAGSDAAVERLRQRKQREEKPFAVMYPSLAAIARDCELSPSEVRLLSSPESPIVLLRRKPETGGIAAAVAPRNPYLGVMVPYAPLHHLLLEDAGRPVVATSGNLADEPICTDEGAAFDRLGSIADAFLVHDRPIVRHVDDSIVRVMLGRELVLRRARGYAPLPVPLGGSGPAIAAVGGHLKNTVAVAAGSNVFISQHIGDLETESATEAFRAVFASLQSLHGVCPSAVAADLHPDYLSTKYARALRLPVVHVQHHYAHVASCMAENDLNGPVLGVSWDGTGYGPDGTIWGGEFLLVGDAARPSPVPYVRAACLRPFRLPGGERAVREPRRSALGLLDAIGAASAVEDFLAHAFMRGECHLLKHALAHGINAPVTTSAGRLFDALAALLGLRLETTFEGQAAMDLEFAADKGEHEDDDHNAVMGPYPFEVSDDVERYWPAGIDWDQPAAVVDWEPLVRAVIDDMHRGTRVSAVASRIHDTLAEMIVRVAMRVGEPRVVLTGGCFQNRHLTERAVVRLRDAGFRPYWHQRVPPNDGGLSLGQIAAARRNSECVLLYQDGS